MKYTNTILLILLVVIGMCVMEGRGEEAERSGFWSVGAMRAENGGVPCVACTMLSQSLIVKVESENTTVDQALASFCTTLPPPVNKACEVFMSENGDALVTAFLDFESPDRICWSLGVCTNPQECPMYPSSVPINATLLQPPPYSGLLDVNGWLDWIVNRFGNKHLPLDDIDNDYFSPLWKAFRGRDWRGRDCNDLDKRAYPGMKPLHWDKQFDSNCNGILGVNPDSNKPWEQELCTVEQRGVGLLGDSVGAHFAFPVSWYFPSPGIYDNAFYVLANEIDFPYTSWITGFRNDTSGQLDPGRPKPLDSVYLRLKERNRCNHRDFQNLAVNGADSHLSINNLHAIARNPFADQPMLFFQALIGDDICDHRSESGWTTPEQFRENIMTNLNYLDTKLPKGSFVVNIGLVDGKVIWDTLHDLPYPFQYDILGGTYTNFWDFMNCLNVNPCWGWLQSNATIRNAATQRARELSAVYGQIMSNTTFSNFEMAYYDFPIIEIAERHIAAGGKPSDLFEPFLGMHTTQVAVALLAEILWEKLERDHPQALGPINPNNAKIDQLFGDQGGY